MLAESSTAATLAAAIDREVQASQHSTVQPGDFSIAAVQSSASSSLEPTASLLTALLHSAIACSSSVQLSEQFLSAGLMQTITALLDQGSVHNPQTAFAVELLWNLLDSCPVADLKAASSSTAANTGPRMQLGNAQSSARLSGEDADVDGGQLETSGSQGAASVTFTTELVAGTSADLSQPGSANWDMAQGSQDLTAVAAQALSTADDLSATGRSTSQSRHGTSIRFSELGGDAAETASTSSRNISPNGASGNSRNISPNGASGSSRNTSPNSASDRSDNPSPSSQHDQPLPPDESNADSAASPASDTDSDPDAQQLASSLTRVFEDCLEHGYSQADKELRNTVLLVAGLLSESSTYRAALCQAGLLQTLLAVSTEPELQEQAPAYFKVAHNSCQQGPLPCYVCQTHSHDLGWGSGKESSACGYSPFLKL